MKSAAEHAVVTTIAVDLAKEVYQLALADSNSCTRAERGQVSILLV